MNGKIVFHRKQNEVPEQDNPGMMYLPVVAILILPKHGLYLLPVSQHGRLRGQTLKSRSLELKSVCHAYRTNCWKQ